METRANFVLIGAFTLVGLIGAFAFLLWLAKFSTDQQYAYYDVLFESVAGLGTAGDVRYNGLKVGQVVSLNLDDKDPSRVRVRLEVEEKTPITTETVAVLESQGVTGVSYVSLQNDNPGGKPLAEFSVIPSKRSPLQSIFEGAPELLNKAVDLLDKLNNVVSTQNQQAVTDLLSNLSSASEKVDTVMGEFEGLSKDISAASKEISNFTGELKTLSDTAQTTLNTATTTLETADTAIKKAEGAISTVEATLNSAKTTFDTADQLMKGDVAEMLKSGAAAAATVNETVQTLTPVVDTTLKAAETFANARLPQLMTGIENTVKSLDGHVDTLAGEATSLIARYTKVGDEIQQRAEQSKELIDNFNTATQQANTTLDSVKTTSDAATKFIEEQGKPLADQATQSLASIQTLTQDTLPPLVEQATTTLNFVDQQARELSESGQKMITAATDRLDEAQKTLQDIDTAIDQTTKTMVSVEKTSDYLYDLTFGTGTKMVEDISAAMAEVQKSVATINETVQRDLPGVMQNVTQAADTANSVIQTVGADVTKISGRIDGITVDAQDALKSVTSVMTNANETLSVVNTAVTTANGTLATAQKTFSLANNAITEDLQPMISNIHTSVDNMTQSINKVAQEVDAVTADVRVVSSSAADLLGTVNSIVQENRRQVSEFLRLGLPQLLGFIEEARRLVINLERLADRIERDPARFLLGTQGSTFRR
ncbi:MlaD family protein [Chachezhania antarctica]|uniref:MlaD family protein n=1 Tax=Chachezhania antarctica TaxID=2340860 RepID=UPI000EB31FE9|nr:MlaD family protein [Chachezhania antarctica]